MDLLYIRILEELERLNITGKELGRRLELKKSPLTDWKNGKSKPTLEQLVKLCDIFATSADYLLFGISSHSLSLEETTLLNAYKKLSMDDQEEILSIIDLKLQRANRTSGVKSKSSVSNHIAENNNAAV